MRSDVARDAMGRFATCEDYQKNGTPKRLHMRFLTFVLVRAIDEIIGKYRGLSASFMLTGTGVWEGYGVDAREKASQ